MRVTARSGKGSEEQQQVLGGSWDERHSSLLICHVPREKSPGCTEIKCWDSQMPTASGFQNVVFLRTTVAKEDSQPVTSEGV